MTGTGTSEDRRQDGIRLEWNRLRVVAIVAPAAFVAAVIALTLALADDVHTVLLISLAILTVTAAASLFSALVFRVIEMSEARLVERNDQLAAVQEAAMSLSSAFSLDAILQRFVELSREITGARYGAMAVLAPDGSIADFITSGITEEEREKLGDPPTGHGLLGVIINEGETLRMPDLTKDPRSEGFPPHHPPMRSLLGVPVLSKGQIIGNLYLTDKEDGTFTESDEEMVRTFAANAAVAVENSRLQEKMRSLAVLQERERIGMDLHDGIIQSIYAVALGLEATSEDVDQKPADARNGIERAIGQLNEVITDVRSYIFKLGPERSSHDLVAALANLAKEFRINSLVETSVDVAADLPKLEPDQQEVIYHVAQEALANARRHARASAVSLSLRPQNGVVRLRVTDNGEGFDASAEVSEAHRGLRNMMARAKAVDGDVRIESGHRQGTMVELSVPLER
jgi:signal transduction histidine kinase